MPSLLKAALSGVKGGSLEEFRRERTVAADCINAVDGVRKPTQRRIMLQKQANSRFGVDLCRIGGRIFLLKVDETKTIDSFGEYLPGLRAGLSRFDELIQIEEQDVTNRTLPMVYKYLQEVQKVNITVADRPLVRTYTISAEDDAADLRECLVATGIHDDLVYTGHNTKVPAGEAIVEINGELVLGMKLHEVAAVLGYAKDKNGGVFTVSTLHVDIAASFLSAYIETTAVFGSKDWKAGELLRRSVRHNKRRSSFSNSLKSLSMTTLRTGNSLSTTSLRAGRNNCSRATNLDQATIERARALLLAE